MSQSQTIENPSMKRVDALKAIQPNNYELWKYYEERADRLGERLWSVGIWLMTVLTATLSLPFGAGFIKPSSTFFPIQVISRVPVAMLGLFGILFCVYSYAALSDIREHIESNWRKAGYILSGTWEANWGGRKSHGWNVLLAIGGLAFVAFVFLFGLALFTEQS